MRRFVFIPAVVTFGYLFRGVRAFCVRCQNILQLLLLVLFSIWRPSIVIDGRASSDRSPGPILVSIRWSPCLCLVWVLWVRCRHIGSLRCVCGTRCMRRVRVVFNVLVSLLLCDNGRKVIMIIFYHNSDQCGARLWPPSTVYYNTRDTDIVSPPPAVPLWINVRFILPGHLQSYRRQIVI